MELLLVSKFLSLLYTKLTSHRVYRRRDPQPLKVFIAIVVYVMRPNTYQCVSNAMVPSDF